MPQKAKNVHIRSAAFQILRPLLCLIVDESLAYSDSVISVGLDLIGKNKWAGRVRAETRRMIERDKKDQSQPYLELKDYIDSLILEGDKLKLQAEEYLLKNQP